MRVKLVKRQEEEVTLEGLTLRHFLDLHPFHTDCGEAILREQKTYSYTMAKHGTADAD